MVKKNLHSRVWLLSRITVCLAAVIFLCLWQAPGGSSPTAAKAPQKLDEIVGRRPPRREGAPNTESQDALKKVLLKGMGGNFGMSQEMKENVDFVLTPALLMQEIVSDDVVITYPTE